MDNFNIIDDFFSELIVNKIKEIIQNENWKKCKKNNIIINNYNYPNNTFRFFNPDDPFWRLELNSYFFFSNILLNIIEKKLNKKFSLRQIYAVSQFYEQNSNFHIDYDKENSLTFCYYINLCKDSKIDIYENTEGYFYLKIPEDKKIIAINPKNNRGIIFPSNFIHRGVGFNKNSNELRICIAWKLIEIN